MVWSWCCFTFLAQLCSLTLTNFYRISVLIIALNLASFMVNAIRQCPFLSDNHLTPCFTDYERFSLVHNKQGNTLILWENKTLKETYV